MTAPRAGLATQLAQAAIMAAAVWLFLQPLSTAPGLIVALACTFAAYAGAFAATRAGLRARAGVAIGAALVVLGHLGSGAVLARELMSTTATIELGDALYLGLGLGGILFALRVLRERVRAVALVEVGLVIGAVAHTFSDHRHQRIHQPRFLSDWAWSNGIDPHTVLAAAGIATVMLALVMLLRGQRLAKLLISLVLLLLVGLGAYRLAGDTHLAPDVDTNGLGIAGAGDGSGGGASGRGGGGGRPDPVAVAVLHDDLELDGGILYFRQTARSRLAGERLVEDNTGRFDRDVLVKYPSGAPVVAEPTQVPALHTRVPTSMYLMIPHPQPVGLAHPLHYTPLANPDPRRFVAAYGVESMVAHADPRRLLGRTAVPLYWTDDERRHYLAIPDDPRYAQLAQAITRELDPRFVNEPVMVAFAIKRFLEVEGFYSLAQRELVGTDPVARFLFGELRGYCVHFAHAAVFLFRSQGIPARVALGYAVGTATRGTGSSILILGRNAHAWPEIFLDGVGWVTFDVYPERSDEPRPPPVDAELEQLLGELARKDPTGGRAGDPHAGRYIPWAELGGALAALLGALVAAGYAVKLARRARTATAGLVFRGFLDRLSDLGAHRRLGETRERHAARLAALAPSFAALTDAHLRWALGPPARAAGAAGATTSTRTSRSRAPPAPSCAAPSRATGACSRSSTRSAGCSPAKEPHVPRPCP